MSKLCSKFALNKTKNHNEPIKGKNTIAINLVSKRIEGRNLIQNEIETTQSKYGIRNT